MKVLKKVLISIGHFFRNIWRYIMTNAWIQPILIVVVIFVLLFSLNPLTEAIKKGWTNLTSVNKMEKITYQEYVELVKSCDESAEDEKYLVVFVAKDQSLCNDLYDVMNEFLKTDAYKDGTFKIYCVDLTIKDSTTKIAERDYNKFKDTTCGIVSDSNIPNAEADSLDHVKKLDSRVEAFVNSFGGSYSDISTYPINKETKSYYTYVAAPLFVWYENGLETRISNTWSSETQSTASAFREFISDFEGSAEADNWDEDFDLTYNAK